MPQKQDFLPNYLSDEVAVQLGALYQEYDVLFVSAMLWRNEAPWRLDWRTVSDTFFLIPLHGRLRLFVDEGQELIAPGQFLMLSDHTPHAIELIDGERKLDQVAIHCHINNRWGMPLLERFSTHVGIVPDLRSWKRELFALCWLASRSTERDVAGRKARALVMQLLGFQIQSGLVMEKGDGEIDPRLARAIEWMDQHLGAPELSVETLARKVELSPVRFRKLFRQMFGCGPREYLVAMRLRRAAQLLRESPRQVKRIARDVGFSSDHYFHRCFRAHYGRTPSAFREAQDNAV